jgi:hypothetical protein
VYFSIEANSPPHFFDKNFGPGYQAKGVLIRILLFGLMELDLPTPSFLENVPGQLDGVSTPKNTFARIKK